MCLLKIYSFKQDYILSSVDEHYDKTLWKMIKISNEKNKLTLTHISCGSSHNIVMTKDKKVYSWGANDVGQLGINTNVSHSIPVEVRQLKNVIIGNVKSFGKSKT